MKTISWLPHCKILNGEDIRYNEDRAFLRRAYINASRLSNDPKTTNGSVLVQGERIIDGANQFPRGVKETPERWERPKKYIYVEHAERQVIFTSARCGWSIQDAKLYCTWYACTDCARAIIQSGIQTVIGHAAMFDFTPDHWRESIQQAFVMFEEAGIECLAYEGRIFEEPSETPALRFNGEIWRP